MAGLNNPPHIYINIYVDNIHSLLSNEDHYLALFLRFWLMIPLFFYLYFSRDYQTPQKNNQKTIYINIYDVCLVVYT